MSKFYLRRFDKLYQAVIKLLIDKLLSYLQDNRSPQYIKGR